MVENLPPVSATAVGVAAIRAAETTRPDRLFTDPLAGAFVAAAGLSFSRPETPETRQRRASLVGWVTIRTRFLDEVVLDACRAGCRQFVILGAGLDARAFRLAWPDATSVYELDLPDVLAFKERVVADSTVTTRCARTVVPTDLTGPWTGDLLGAGFDPARPVTWIAEGLIAYLSAAHNDALLTGVGGLSPAGSRLGLTLASRRRLEEWHAAHPDGGADSGDYVALFRSAAPDQATQWLAEHGWKAELFSARERAVAYGRPPTGPPPEEDRGARLVSAIRRA